MGIPGFFSNILKNYASIIQNRHFHRTNGTLFHSLYMDCNSIVYDSYYALIKHADNTYNRVEFESSLIQHVIAKIDEYIRQINPTCTLYISFDGVAPFAKMDQQRTRRYKSWYNSILDFNRDSNRECDTNKSHFKWDTAAITPGTLFLKNLSNAVTCAFLNAELKYGVNRIIVSTSEEPGEGEHKMFQYIRSNRDPQLSENVMVYGLDADLIMLSIFHCHYCKNIYVFREAPEFIKSRVIEGVEPNELLFMDIQLLNTSIIREMDCAYNDPHRTHDYLFLCFLLGNDFLPHFPAFNIRTSGIQILLDTYRNKIGGYHDRFFISKKTFKIQWKWVLFFMTELANHEHEYILQEYAVRDKMNHYQWSQTTPEEKEKMLSNAPIIYRAEEKYICPEEPGWEQRYYKALFGKKCNTKSICHNYLEGLEWVFRYYTAGCPDWKWKYNYSYPPLLKDLIQYIPKQEMNFICSDSVLNRPFLPSVQLAYVLPPAYHYLMGDKVKSYLHREYMRFYPEEFSFQWAFCRYFWEAHVLLPEIPIELLEKWNIHAKFQDL
jgi:5'-3' exonuclease